MSVRLSVAEIRRLGFEWPKHARLEEHCVTEEGRVDLQATIESLRSSQAFYEEQLNAAFAFKQQTGADYSDFTDRFDDDARARRELGAAIAYLTSIVEATNP
jgi:hypothetical protein